MSAHLCDSDTCTRSGFETAVVEEMSTLLTMRGADGRHFTIECHNHFSKHLRGRQCTIAHNAPGRECVVTVRDERYNAWVTM